MNYIDIAIVPNKWALPRSSDYDLILEQEEMAHIIGCNDNYCEGEMPLLVHIL